MQRTEAMLKSELGQAINTIVCILDVYCLCSFDIMLCLGQNLASYPLCLFLCTDMGEKGFSPFRIASLVLRSKEEPFSCRWMQFALKFHGCSSQFLSGLTCGNTVIDLPQVEYTAWFVQWNATAHTSHTSGQAPGLGGFGQYKTDSISFGKLTFCIDIFALLLLIIDIFQTDGEKERGVHKCVCRQMGRISEELLKGKI